MFQRSTLGLLGCALAIVVAACGGSSVSSSEASCITDSQCKGERICEDGVCVDPHGTEPGAGGSGGSVSGTGGAGGSSSGKPPQAGNGVIDDPELEQACNLDCEARQTAACPMNTGSVDQCRAQCLVVDESSQGYCLDEMTARYACSASGGYTCVSGYAQPRSTCIAESTALSQCSQKIPCWSYCDKLPADCDAAGEGCFDSCTKDQMQFTDAICGVYYNQLLACWARGVTCTDGKPTVGSCGSAVSEVADCIGRRNHDCDGYCWAAETLGCGADDCVATCKAKTDAASCGSYYRNLIDCATSTTSSSSSRDINLTCEAGQPVINASNCMSYLQQYDNCMMTQ